MFTLFYMQVVVLVMMIREIVTLDDEVEEEEEEISKVFYLHSSNFCKIVNTSAFVDKTLLIREFFKGPNQVLITAPRRFGRSTNLDMLKRFVERVVEDKKPTVKPTTTTETLVLTVTSEEEETGMSDPFEKLNICLAKQICKSHKAKYPVIYVDFKSVPGVDLDNVLENFKTQMFKIFDKHKYLLRSKKLNKVNKAILMKYTDLNNNYSLSQSEVEGSLQFLSKYLFTHFNKKVIVLMDDYDLPLLDVLDYNSSNTSAIIDFMRRITFRLLQENQYVERALITANSITLSRVLTENLDIQYFPFLHDHKFAEYYGFTETEVGNLVKKFNVSEHLNCLKQWYYGYKIQGKREKIFNVWSVLNCLKTCRVESYWVIKGSIPNLLDIFLVPEVRTKMTKLVEKKMFTIKRIDKLSVDQLICFQNFLHSPLNHDGCDGVNVVELFFQFLMDKGYLHVLKEEGDQLTITIPNAETGHELIQNFYAAAVNSDVMTLSPVKDAPLIKALALLRERYHNITYW